MCLGVPEFTVRKSVPPRRCQKEKELHERQGEKRKFKTVTDTLTRSHTWSPALSASAKLKASWLDDTDGKRLSPFDQGRTIEVEDESLFPRGKR